jgi:hypothetical protein
MSMLGAVIAAGAISQTAVTHLGQLTSAPAKKARARSNKLAFVCVLSVAGAASLIAQSLLVHALMKTLGGCLRRAGGRVILILIGILIRALCECAQLSFSPSVSFVLN